MVPTLFSVSYAGLWGQAQLGLEAFIVKAAELGYEAVALMGKRPHLSAVDTTEEELAVLGAMADSAGVKIATIAGYTDFTASQSAAEVPFVEMQVAYEMCSPLRGGGSMKNLDATATKSLAKIKALLQEA